MFPLKQQLILAFVPIVVFFWVFRFLTMPRSPFIERAMRLPNSEASSSNFSHYQPLSSADYPRTYRISLGWRVFDLIFEFWAISVGISTLRSALAGPQVRVRLVPGILFTIGGILAMVQNVKYRAVLSADSIEVHNLASTRVLRRDEILGRRLLQAVRYKGYQTILLVPRGAQRALGVDLVLKTDSAFWEWMDTVPDLDAQDHL
jgi:hypothetical protein